MASRKKSDIETSDTESPALPKPSSQELVRVVITKFGDGKVSTGVHIAGQGDVMARRGDVLEACIEGARTMEAAGHVEIVE